MKNYKYAFLAAFLLLTACTTTDSAQVAEQEVPVEQIYNRAKNALDAGDYKEAVKSFDEVEQKYPYSELATKAQLMSAYTSYSNGQYDDAVMALERYIALHPGHKDAAYAYYLMALCYYDQISDVRRDQKVTERAMDALSQVVNRFPDSDYAKDAKFKLDLTRDHLAGKEMEIGRYYLRRGIYNAAINRFRGVLEKYQTTSHTPEALHRLVEAYLALGLKEEAQKAAAVLGHNYPNSEWYTDSYADLVDPSVRAEAEDKDTPWLRKMWNSVF